MTELSYAQAISVGDQIVMELNILDQQKRALVRIVELLGKAREAEKLLSSLDAERTARESSLADLEQRYAQRNAIHNHEHQAYVNTLLAEEQAARAKIGAIREELLKAENVLVERERAIQLRIDTLDVQIAAKTAALEKVTNDFNNFLKLHNLGGA
jgi:hypothetical protein